MKPLLRSVSALALVGASLSAHASIVDFEDLPNDPLLDTNVYEVSVISGGYAFETGPMFGSWTPLTEIGNYTGSLALYSRSNREDPIVMTAVGGGAFTLNSMQLANLYLLDLDNGVFQGSTIDFFGTKLGGGTVTQSFTVEEGNDLQTVTFSGFTNVSSVTWNQAYFFHQFDNIDVQAVPEPSAIAALGFGAFAVFRRRARLR